MEEITQGLDKYRFMQFVSRRMKHKVHYLHILAILGILLDEMAADLAIGKSIKISNFGTFKIIQTPDRKHKIVGTHKEVTSKGNKKIKFNLLPKIRKKIFQHLDVDKMLKDE